MATDRPRYTVSVDPEMFQRIEDFRFQHRFQTRSRATEALIRKGLEQAEREEKEGGEYPPNCKAAAGGTAAERRGPRDPARRHAFRPHSRANGYGGEMRRCMILTLFCPK